MFIGKNKEMNKTIIVKICSIIIGKFEPLTTTVCLFFMKIIMCLWDMRKSKMYNEEIRIQLKRQLGEALLWFCLFEIDTNSSIHFDAIKFRPARSSETLLKSTFSHLFLSKTQLEYIHKRSGRVKFVTMFAILLLQL